MSGCDAPLYKAAGRVPSPRISTFHRLAASLITPDGANSPLGVKSTCEPLCIETYFYQCKRASHFFYRLGSFNLSLRLSIDSMAASSFSTRSVSSFILLCRFLEFAWFLSRYSLRVSNDSPPSVPTTRAFQQSATISAPGRDRFGSRSIACWTDVCMTPGVRRGISLYGPCVWAWQSDRALQGLVCAGNATAAELLHWRAARSP